MRYILIDKVIEFEIGQNLKGIKNVTYSDGLARPYGANWNALPAPFLLEAMAQAAGLLVAATIEYRTQPVLAKVQQLQIYGRAAAGDQIELFAHLEDLNESGAKLFVSAQINGALLADGIIFLGLIPFTELSEDAAFERRKKLRSRLVDLFPNLFEKN